MVEKYCLPKTDKYNLDIFSSFVSNMIDSFEELTVAEDTRFLRFILWIKDFPSFLPTFWTSLSSLLMKISLFLF